MNRKRFIICCVIILIVSYIIVNAETKIIGENKNIPSTTTISLTSVGDIMCHKTQLKSVTNNTNFDFNDWFKPIKHHIINSDIAICNLETTFAGEDQNYSSYPMFNTPSQLGDAIKDCGFDVVTTANNHCLDRKNIGINRTIEKLNSLNLEHTGTYRNKNEFYSILIKDVQGIKLAIFSYTYGTNGIPIPDTNPYAVNIINKDRMLEDIKKAREEESDLIIFALHFGNEYERNPSNEQKELADFLFKNGAHIILGSHPHVIQPSEVKLVENIYGETNKCFVIYSQGNFISNQRKQYRDSGLITTLKITKNHSTDNTQIEDIHFIPTWVDRSIINNTVDFRIIPVIDSINNYAKKTDIKIDKYDYERLKQVLVETKNQLLNDNFK